MNLREQIEKTLDFSDDVGLTEDQLRYLLNIILAQPSAKTYGISTQPNITINPYPLQGTIITSNGTPMLNNLDNKTP